ncbi:glycosyltransferase family 2 protein [Candidatus Gottesmanbacteria bacterium]|nr:glycosyltransferase family 2 protein [Candidatus Gottesmanbacteria bacterium]
MKPYVSVIIPAYNASGTVRRLLESLSHSTFKNFEVIIADDGSHEQLTVNSLGKRMFFPLRVVRLPINRGPAAARNAGVSRAIGAVVVFLDSDVSCYPDTLKRIAEKFQADPDLTAITGVWDKDQKTKQFFPQFKALRDWSYWTNEADRDGYYYLFSTRIAAIKRDVFNRLGGFNEIFRQMEDVEFTYKIARRYAIIFAPDVRVHHEFEGFWPVAKKYFWRSFYWARLYKERKKFDPVATTMWETMAAVSGVGTIAALVVTAFVFLLFPFTWMRLVGITTAIVLFAGHLFLLRKFLWFVYSEKGLGFALKSLGIGLVLYSVILAGALYYQLKQRVSV